ncbi:glyoxalase [Gordonia desulfuricans]|uniref:Glyoxalase n=1 Tax=Gordonia desulfuricans TaxID=89051 RepID=A0A7K3LR57_9ACTN|nr:MULTISPECIES: VOC family protein [Gordonia]EMP13451.1 glyoxalase [Gordonia sp. NB41Y]NDK90037.1 glyoxalase [Gordonia desulfuricans]WLP90805.1 VOC family protein [Gordonia sp. NB41Y]
MSGPYLSFASVIADDIVALSSFYAEVFGLDEVTELRSEHFRGLRLGDTILGFSTSHAYQLLNLTPPRDTSGTTSFITVEVDDEPSVDRLTTAAVAIGARCVAGPTRTYYRAWQSVLLDPEGNAFRINHLRLGDH